jgi:ParB family chromosome partitioning protein
MTEVRRLGRGLEALLGPISREQAEVTGALRDLPVSQIAPNPYQPRTRLDEPALAELTASIEVSGLLQPIVVRPKGTSFELIAGERRWRAVQRLGWPTIPAVVKDVDDQTLLTLALIENLQRNDLSPIDEAQGYHRLMQQFAVPQLEVARLVGRNRSTVANLLRLLRLPPDVRELVHQGALSEGHARALLALENDDAIIRLARQAVADGWSVREIEERVRGEGRVAPAARRRRDAKALAPDARRVEEVLRRRLGTDVRVHPRRRGRGFLTMQYYSNDDLSRLLELILGEPYGG